MREHVVMCVCVCVFDIPARKCTSNSLWLQSLTNMHIRIPTDGQAKEKVALKKTGP